MATLLERLREQAATENIRLTQHAHQEMVEESISFDEVLQTIATARVLENYPTHKRGPCCLLGGVSDTGRPVHVVCTTAQPTLIVITVYEPRPPKWVTPSERSGER